MIEDAIELSLKELRERIEEFDKNGKYCLVCRSGLRSWVAFSYMKKNGFKDVKMLEGGLTKFKDEEKPIHVMKCSV